MGLRSLAFAGLAALALAGCTARTPPANAPMAPAAGPAVSQQADPQQAELQQTDPQQADPQQADPQPAADVPRLAGQFAEPSRSCRTDSDCAVKDVGNCCGYFPMCVNKDARTDPAAVRAQCGKDGMSSICGFREISGCQCVDNRCVDLTDDAVAR
ncbi:MAG TPA: hypothetical protein VFQ84_06100 [Arenimonas sp.]|uniref:hypothetical protein n=1 Tax=Arenimonas sp. TaxID=1872635 RepID=UPI002D7E7D70|nr:hypothetical protein [Arenimonas sp.]HEU0152898.1 hypothetical protein [Arenimonas sp.]